MQFRQIYLKSLEYNYFIRLDILNSAISSVQENLEFQRTVSTRVESLEAKLNACNSSLEWIVSALLNKNFVPQNIPGTGELSELEQQIV